MNLIFNLYYNTSPRVGSNFPLTSETQHMWYLIEIGGELWS